MTLRIYLFQQLEVRNGDGDLLDLGSPTTRSLFAYLVVNHPQSIDRRRLAFQFWPRSSEQAARRNLRQYLHRIRRALESVDPDGKILNTEGNDVSIRLPKGCFLDVTEFQTAVTPPHTNLPYAVELYRGELLEDIYEDWVIPERERLAQRYREALLHLIDQKEAAQQYPEAIQYARLLLAADPLQESGHVRLMQLYYAAGDRARVKQQYEQLTAVLEKELGIEPMPETTAIFADMTAGKYNSLSRLQPAPPETGSKTAVHPEQPAAPFVGRQKELEWLRQRHPGNNTGGSFCFVGGESGIGKTRLVNEALAEAGNVYIFRGRGHEFESMIPYSPLVEALRNAAAEGLPWERFQPPPPWMAALLPILPDLPAVFPGHDLTTLQATRQYHTIEGLGNFLLALARYRPIILYLDNLHWADAPTWNFLGYLAQRLAQSPIQIIGVARIEDIPPDRLRLLRQMERMGQIQNLTLERLSQEETLLLVQQMMGDKPLDNLFARRIYEETEGNPFFIIETTRAVREAGGDWTQSVPTDQAGQRPFFAIPLQVQAVIESRLDKLSDDSRAALGVAATIGREFSFDLLQNVSQFDTQSLLDALDEWLARGLVKEIRDGYDFTHDKLSQVAYQKLSRARRQWIHFQVAEYLANNRPDADPAQLAHHYYRSNEPGKALPYLAKAGQRALAVRSYAEAREFGLQAIGLMGRFPSLNKSDRTERIDLNMQLSQAYAYTGALPKALEILQETERTAEAIGDISRLTRIFHRSSQIFWLRGRPDTADAYARRVLRHAEELDDADMRFAALRMLGRANIVLSRFDDAIAYLIRYIDLAEKGPPPPDLPAIYGYLGVAYARVGSWQRAIDAAQTGQDLASAAPSGSMYVVATMQLAFVYAELHEWQQALTIAEPVRDLWREDGMTPHAFMLRSVISRCMMNTGQPEAGEEEMTAAIHWAETVDHRVLVHAVYIYLAQSQLLQGKREKALATAVTAAKQSAAAGNRWSEAVALRVQAEIGMTLPKPDWPLIETNLLQSMNLLRDIRARPDLARTYLTMRRLYDRAGQTAWAVDCHFRATTIFDELGMDDERRAAQGQAAGDRTGAVVIPGLALQGPNIGQDNHTAII